jgi:hypothetical protein
MKPRGGNALWYITLVLISGIVIGAAVHPISHAGPNGQGDVPALSSSVARSLIAHDADTCEVGFNQGCVTLSNYNLAISATNMVRGSSDPNWSDLGVANGEGVAGSRNAVIQLANLADIRIRNVSYANASSHLASVTWDATVAYTPAYHKFFAEIPSANDYSLSAIRRHVGLRTPNITSTFKYVDDLTGGSPGWKYDPADRGSTLFAAKRSTLFAGYAVGIAILILIIVGFIALFRFAPWVAIPLTFLALESLGKE